MAGSTQKIIVLCAGHGGKDPGAISPDGRFKEAVEATRLRDMVADKLRAEGLPVITDGNRGQNQPLKEARKIASVRSFFKFLRQTKVVAENPAEWLQTPKVSNDLDHLLSEDDVKALIGAVTSERDSLLLRLLYVSAGRISEVRAICPVNLTPLDDGGG